MEVADAPALVILGDEKRKARGRFHNLPVHCLGERIKSRKQHCSVGDDYGRVLFNLELTRHELLQALKILINVRSRRNDPRANGAEKNGIDCEELHNALRVGCIKRCLELLDDLECLLFRTGERRQRRRYHYRAGQEEFAHGFAPVHCFMRKSSVKLEHQITRWTSTRLRRTRPWRQALGSFLLQCVKSQLALNGPLGVSAARAVIRG